MDNILLPIVTALISGLIAVIVTLYWQKRTATYNRKMRVFEKLMMYRVPEKAHFKETVPVFNSIDVIFYDDGDVRKAYKDFIDESNKSPEGISNSLDKHQKLLEVMAKSLGLKKLTWEDIKNSYFPNAYSRLLEDEEMLRKTAIMNNIESGKFIHEFINRQSAKEEKVQNDQ